MSEPEDDPVKTAKVLVREGKAFQAYNTLRAALEEGAPDGKDETAARVAHLRSRPLDLRYQAVLLLARLGATQEARRRYLELGLDGEGDDDSRSLWGRLRKDEALELQGEDRARAFASAAAIYQAVWEGEQDTASRNPFPGINAATLRTLSGDHAAGRRIARAILDKLEGEPPESLPFWDHATIAEARLILHDSGGVAAALRTAATYPDFGPMDRGSTIRQMRLLAAHLTPGFDPCREIAPGPVLFYSGHMIAAPGKAGRIRAENEGVLRQRIESRLRKLDPSAGVGSLACGSDIILAETLLDMGAQVHVVLPFDRAEFIDLSVKRGGEGWAERFEACWARATTHRYLTEQPYLGDDILFGQCARLAMGRAILIAQQVMADVRAVAVWDGERTGGIAGSSHDLAVWQRTGRGEAEIIDCNDLGDTGPQNGAQHVAPTAASAVSDGLDLLKMERGLTVMTFGDVKGFSKVGDGEMRTFIEEVLGRIGRAMEPGRAERIFTNTWGDGIFCVYSRPDAALREALAIQSSLDGLEPEALGLPPDVALRLACHMGVVWHARDPITATANFYGEAVARTARMEPVTPPGAVYVSETFAAELALDPGGEYTADYVGQVPTAKGFGEMHLYRLRRRQAAYRVTAAG